MMSRVVAGFGALACLYGARRFYRNWGTTKHECQMSLPGDELVRSPRVQSTEAISIDAPAAAVWPWLLQIGQDRGGFYSFERVENLLGLHCRNAESIHQEWQQVSPGDVVRLSPKGWLGVREGLALRVVQIAAESDLIFRAMPTGPWQTVWSFHLLPIDADRCRLIIRTRTGLRRPGEVLATEIAGPALAFLTRGMLIGIKRRAETIHLQTDGRPPLLPQSSESCCQVE
jgi:hypothetical protein